MARIVALLAGLGLFLCPCKPACAAVETSSRPQTPEYYFWNEVTGDVQWEDPGGMYGLLGLKIGGVSMLPSAAEFCKGAEPLQCHMQMSPMRPLLAVCTGLKKMVLSEIRMRR